MTNSQITLSWHAKEFLTADRLRSFLKYLAQREVPLRFIGFPTNLYSASETLASGLQSLRIQLIENSIHGTTAVILSVRGEGTAHVVSLRLDANSEFLSLFASRPGLSILSAGARVLAASQATITLSRSLDKQTEIDTSQGNLAPGSHLIAVWTSTGTTAKTGNLALLEEQWDGARLWLRLPFSDTILQQAARLALTRNRSALGDPPPDPAAQPADPAALTRILQEALCSPDWRTRILAMLSAVHSNFTDLALPIRQMDIPGTSVPGVTNELRHMLFAIRKASLLLLGGVSVPPLEATSSNTRPGMQAHLLRLVAGQNVAFEDSFSNLIHSLEPRGPRT